MLDLAFRSFMVLGALFGLLFAILMAALVAMDLPSNTDLWIGLGGTIAISLLQFAISPYILQWMLRINWIEPEQLGGSIAQRLRDMCLQKNLPVPRFGVIEDGNPNAFTFGHYPGDARLVVTRGLLDMLNEDEVGAVMAHELGHIKHWDFVVMTVAATVPLVLYVIYRFGFQWGGKVRKAGAPVMAVAVTAFVAYIISQYIVLFLSRTREYYADQFSCVITGSPNLLASSLVKIAYGLARAEPAAAQQQGRGAVSLVASGGSKMMGIFDPKFGNSMALSSAASYSASTHTYDSATTINAMKWDIWNPWAMIAELSSSHPLPARRIRHLQGLSHLMGERPLYDLPPRPSESYWDDFATDVFFQYLPLLGLIAGAVTGLAMAGVTGPAAVLTVALAVGGAALGNIVRMLFAYPKNRFESSNVADLVGEVKVSNIRCHPATLRGRIIGRGIPGLYWSEDLVVQDETGFMVMDYRQPLRIFEFLFGLFRADSFVGQNVVAQGWYRRYPSPYLELWRVQLPDGTIHTCHNWAYQFWGSIVLTVLAAFGVLVGVGVLLSG
ncbi:MAG: zinc metalloprotease HtpX [Armatimonadia bacterium]